MRISPAAQFAAAEIARGIYSQSGVEELIQTAIRAETQPLIKALEMVCAEAHKNVTPGSTYTVTPALQAVYDALERYGGDL